LIIVTKKNLEYFISKSPWFIVNR